MNVRIFDGNHHDPPGDVVVIIDVLRAFSTTHFLFLKGFESIRLVGTVEEAFLLKEQFPKSYLVGEINGYKIDGFDLGNSPEEVENNHLDPSYLVFMKTTNGVKSALTAKTSDYSLATGLLGAKVTVEYIKTLLPGRGVVNLIATNPQSDEDRACAEFMKDSLLGLSTSEDLTINRVRGSFGAKKFLDNSMPEFKQVDLDLCAGFGAPAFVMKLENKDEKTFLKKVDT